MKCLQCDKDTEYVYDGMSLCFIHVREYITTLEKKHHELMIKRHKEWEETKKCIR